jgi:flagellar assembly factor FliW
MALYMLSYLIIESLRKEKISMCVVEPFFFLKKKNLKIKMFDLRSKN